MEREVLHLIWCSSVKKGGGEVKTEKATCVRLLKSGMYVVQGLNLIVGRSTQR